MTSEAIGRLLSSCDDRQREAITSDKRPLLVVANAGSGKTRVLTRRIAWHVLNGEIQAERVLALTFTRKAASELRERLSKLGLSEKILAGTFHALALSQLRRRSIDEDRPLPVVLDSKARLLAAVVSDNFHYSRDNRRRLERREILSALAAEIEWAKARGVPPDRYGACTTEIERASVLDLEFVASAYRSYEVEKSRRHVLDFDDLLSELTAAMKDSPDFAAIQRWRFRHFFVDEFQDASPIQLDLLDAWLGDRPDLFAVGDPRQAIYGWNGADANAVVNFADRYSNATVIHLTTNYRSTPQVVAVATAALRRDDRSEMSSPRPDGHVPSVSVYDDDLAEASGVASEVRRTIGPGRRFSDCAVLARTNAQLRLFDEAFRLLGVPAKIGDARTFLAVPEIREALSDLERRLDVPSFTAWLDDLSAAISIPRTDSDHLESNSPALDDIDDSERRVGEQPSRERSTLLRLAREYAELDPRPTGRGCVAYLREALRRDPLSRQTDAVDLMTFHRAKGLEWPLVWVTGLEDGLVPITFAHTKAAIDEERRLLHVALSRAEDELRCSWARARHFGARLSQRDPSPWLVSIENARQALHRNERPSIDVAAKALAESRAALRRAR